MMAVKPKPSAQTKNIYELFAGKVFRIPDYQRTYAWEEKHLKDFWDDIKEGLSTRTEHYWGTITLRAMGESVYCKEKDIPFEIYEVVDGQQRITTIYLFLLALSNVGKPALRDNFVKCGDVYRLELGSINNQFLKELVDGKNPEPTTKTNRLLRGALEYFENQIRTYGNLDNLSDYVQRVTFSLEFIVQDETSAVKAFETLNDRGKPLTLIDRTKSFLMFYSLRYLNNRLSGLINTTFGNIFSNFDFIKEIGEREIIDYIRSERFNEDELLGLFYHYFAYYAIVKYSLPVSYNYDIRTKDVFDQFLKESCNHLKSDPVQLQNFIEEFLSSFGRFVNAFKTIIEKTQSECQYRKIFVFLGLNARVYPLIISLEAEKILDQTFLNVLENLDLRVYKIRGTDPRADLYKNVISRIKTNPNPTQIYNGIVSFIRNFMPDTIFQHYLSLSIYGNPAVKYILWEYEKHQNASFNDCDSTIYEDLQIEHIFPETPTFSFPAHDFQDDIDYHSNIHLFGNLALLEESINKKIRHLTPLSKSSEYQKSNVPSTKSIGFQINNYGFSKNDIINRTQQIVDFCLKRWSL